MEWSPYWLSAEVDGVVGVGGVEPAQEPGDVERVLVALGDFHRQERFGVRGLNNQPVKLFYGRPSRVV